MPEWHRKPPWTILSTSIICSIATASIIFLHTLGPCMSYQSLRRLSTLVSCWNLNRDGAEGACVSTVGRQVTPSPTVQHGRSPEKAITKWSEYCNCHCVAFSIESPEQQTTIYIPEQYSKFMDICIKNEARLTSTSALRIASEYHSSTKLYISSLPHWTRGHGGTH